MTALIRVIGPEEAEGYLREVYEEVREKRGKIANIHKVLSLRPRAMKGHLDLYMAIMFHKEPKGLSRAEREMIAVRVSSLNKCNYCIEHHSRALYVYWRDWERIRALIRDPREAGLSEREEALIRLATKLTVDPPSITSEDIDDLRSRGLSDEEILDAVLVASYFNFINRVAEGLKVEFDEEEATGYKY